MCRFEEINVYIREVGLQKGDSWRKMYRRIYDYQYMFCFKGEAVLILDNQTFNLSPGSLILIPPNIPHLFYVNDENQGELFYVHFDFIYRKDSPIIETFYDVNENYVKLFGNNPLEKEYIRERIKFDNDFSFEKFIQFDDVELLEKIFRSMYQAYIQRGECTSFDTKVYFYKLLSCVIKMNYQKEDYNSRRHKMIVAEMKEYIARNYCRKLMPKEVAESTNLCIDHASRIFSRVTGIKLSEYIIKFKLSKAKVLMLEEDLTLEQIAYMVGFKNQCYFSRVVKKYEEQTPGELRRMIRNELGV